MNSSVGRLLIDGETGFQVDYQIGESGAGVMRGDLAMLMSAYLSHSLELADASGGVLKVVIDTVGDDGGARFHIRGETIVETAVDPIAT